LRKAMQSKLTSSVTLNSDDIVVTFVHVSPGGSLTPKMYKITPRVTDPHHKALDVAYDTFLKELNQSQYDILDTAKGTDVGMVFVGMQNGAQIDVDEAGNAGACVATKIANDEVIAWEHAAECATSMRFDVAEGVRTGQFAGQNPCYFYPHDNCDEDESHDWEDPCPCNEYVHAGNHGEVYPLCTEKSKDGLVVRDNTCNATIDPNGKVTDTDGDGTHDCVDLCPLVAVIPKKDVDGTKVQIAEACTAIVKNEECPDPNDEDAMKRFVDADADNLLACEEVCDLNPEFTHPAEVGTDHPCSACPCNVDTSYDYLKAMGITDGPCADSDGDGVLNCNDECPTSTDLQSRNSCHQCEAELGAGESCPDAHDYCLDDTTIEPPDTDPYKCKCSRNPDQCELTAASSRKECPDIDLPLTKAEIHDMIRAAEKHTVAEKGTEHSVKLVVRGNDGTVCDCVEVDSAGTGVVLKDDGDGVLDCFEDPDCVNDPAGAFLDVCQPDPPTCLKNPMPTSAIGKPLCAANIFKGICNDFDRDTDGDGFSDCMDACPLGSSRQLYMPFGKHDNPNSCRCDWTDAASQSNSDADSVLDCHDVCCSTRKTSSGKTETCDHVFPAYSFDDDNATNTNDDDGDGFHNCYDACPGGRNRDPTDPRSPCEMPLAAPPVVPPVKKLVSEPIHDYEWVLATVAGALAGVVVGVITFRSDDDGTAAAAKAKSDRGK